jgi:hypothetical protein
MAIAALVPKLRLANVLALTCEEHIDPDLRFITVYRHKAVGTLRRRRWSLSASTSGSFSWTRVNAPTPALSSTGIGP